MMDCFSIAEPTVGTKGSDGLVQGKHPVPYRQDPAQGVLGYPVAGGASHALAEILIRGQSGQSGCQGGRILCRDDETTNAILD